MKIYDVTLSYPIKVKARDEDHVKEIILANDLLSNAGELTITIKENNE